MNTLSDLGEFGLIERLSRMLPATPNVLENIGDDCAVLRVFDHMLLLSSDLCIEGIHFRRDLMHPEEIGWKAAAAAISDIAAMGGAPMFSLVSLACPSDTEVTFCEGLYQGLTNVFSRYGGVIAGGDISRIHGPLTIDIAVIGEARQNKCLRRKGALPGDVLAITGLPGLSAGGLHALEHGNRDPDLTQRHCWPPPAGSGRTVALRTFRDPCHARHERRTGPRRRAPVLGERRGAEHRAGTAAYRPRAGRLLRGTRVGPRWNSR